MENFLKIHLPDRNKVEKFNQIKEKLNDKFFIPEKIKESPKKQKISLLNETYNNVQEKLKENIKKPNNYDQIYYEIQIKEYKQKYEQQVEITNLLMNQNIKLENDIKNYKEISDNYKNLKIQLEKNLKEFNQIQKEHNLLLQSKSISLEEYENLKKEDLEKEILINKLIEILNLYKIKIKNLKKFKNKNNKLKLNIKELENYQELLINQFEDLNNRFNNLMRSQVESTIEELEELEINNKDIKNQFNNFDLISKENQFLKHKILNLQIENEKFKNIEPMINELSEIQINCQNLQNKVKEFEQKSEIQLKENNLLKLKIKEFENNNKNIKDLYSKIELLQIENNKLNNNSLNLNQNDNNLLKILENEKINLNNQIIENDFLYSDDFNEEEKLEFSFDD